MKTPQTNYDYIISGAGCAGLSLLYRILKEPSLNGKKILVLDSEKKDKNDRTWCFWEKENGIFQAIVKHEWRTLEFKTEKFTRQFELKHYRYKMIEGIDFYRFVLDYASEFQNVIFRTEKIVKISSSESAATVETEENRYTSRYVFNSTPLFHPDITTKNSLLQHFTGWVIETPTAVFDPTIGTLMDFSVHQNNGTTFMYVLPISPTEALVEYTLFSKSVLSKEKYESALKKYIDEQLKIKQYKIKHTEYGVIPMSLARFHRNPISNASVLNIGTAGGFTKASSGYTFQFIQKNTGQIVSLLKLNKHPHITKSVKDKRFEWYDRTLIDVILSERLEGKEIFAKMFKKVDPEKILQFLANESKVADDLVVMSKLPVIPFFIAGMKQLL